eukprot:Skav209829  [mRNA]  locus=scaffold2703:66012:70687:- [translate_table: standard]
MPWKRSSCSFNFSSKSSINLLTPSSTRCLMRADRSSSGSCFDRNRRISASACSCSDGLNKCASSGCWAGSTSDSVVMARVFCMRGFAPPKGSPTRRQTSQ